MAADIPIIDFESCGLHFDKSSVNDADWKSVGDDILQAWVAVGFCYLKNHGVPAKLVQNLGKSSMEFFQQPSTFKHKFRRRKDRKDNITGWVQVGSETLDSSKSGDFKEAFNYQPTTDLEGWPEDFLQNFRQDVDDFFHTMSDLGVRVLESVTEALGLQKDNEMLNSYKLIGKADNATQVRTLYYPPITDKKDLEKDQVRLGEHFDYGILTLSFQDNTGGLEVCRRDGEWVPVIPVEGTCLAIVGDTLQKWTADKLIATKHRIVIPNDEALLKASRQSFIFFLIPDDDYMVRCLDGSNKYPPRRYKERLQELMKPIYSLK